MGLLAGRTPQPNVAGDSSKWSLIVWSREGSTAGWRALSEHPAPGTQSALPTEKESQGVKPKSRTMNPASCAGWCAKS